MNITMNKKELSRVLSLATNNINKNPTLEVLTNIYLSVVGDTLTVVASDGDVSLEIKTNDIIEVKSEGTVLIDGKTITDAVSKLDGNINIANKDNQVIIDNNIAKYTLHQSNVESYPKIDFSISENEFTVDGNEFIRAISKVVDSVAVSNERPIFTGVHIVSKDGKLEFNATDSYRLSKSYVENFQDVEISTVIPVSTLKTIMKIAVGSELNISTSNTTATFRTPNVLVVTRLLDGLFPDTDRLVPKDFKTHITVDRVDLIQAVDRSSFMKEDNVWILNLSTENGNLKLVTKAREIGSTYEELQANIVGNDISLNLNGRYLLNALNSLEDKEVTFNLVGELQALTVSDSTNQVQLLLPIRSF